MPHAVDVRAAAAVAAAACSLLAPCHPPPNRCPCCRWLLLLPL